MRPLIIASLLIVFLSAFCHQRLSRTATLTCTLKSDKARYKTGELPNFKIEITNNTGKDFYLIGSLDGSDLKWRMPYCYFSIEKPIPDTIKYLRCGNMNTLNPENFRLVKSGATFDPYESIDEYGFFSDFLATNSDTYKNPGLYKIKFHYSTNSKDINDFMGDRIFEQSEKNRQKLSSLLKQVPQVDITSNEIEITFDK